MIAIAIIDCGDVRSRTSYNLGEDQIEGILKIVVTSDLGRVTTGGVIKIGPN